MPLEDVRDAGNPRIQHAVKQSSTNGTLSQDELRKLIFERPEFPELFIGRSAITAVSSSLFACGPMDGSSRATAAQPRNV
jgi:hypothetical protein